MCEVLRLEDARTSQFFIVEVVGFNLSDHPKPATEYHLKTGQRK